MRASWTADRRGIGALVAFVAWVVTLALLWALIASQAGGNALTGVVRVGGIRMAVLAGQSALAEASYVLRHPPEGGSLVLTGIHQGTSSGEAHDPAATRALYEDDVKAGALDIGKVQYEVVHRGPEAKPSEAWLIDLTVRVKVTFAGTPVTRRLRRRFLGRVCRVKSLLGPKKGQVVLTSLAVEGRPVLETIEP